MISIRHTDAVGHDVMISGQLSKLQGGHYFYNDMSDLMYYASTDQRIDSSCDPRNHMASTKDQSDY